MNKKLLLLALLTLVAWYSWQGPLSAPLAEDIGRVVEAPAGFNAAVSIGQPPLQHDLDQPLTIQIDDYLLTLIADFQLEARVLGRRDYRRDAGSRLAPIDLALGWGPMAQADVIDQIAIRQRGRFYFWRVETYPIEHHDIVRNSANMHMIPASPAVFAELQRAERDRHIRLRGFLVNVDRADGWRWRTSTTRTDSGDGACELVLVTAVQVY